MNDNGRVTKYRIIEIERIKYKVCCSCHAKNDFKKNMCTSCGLLLMSEVKYQIKPLDPVIKEITNARERVKHIYNLYPNAIDSDNVLFYCYILPLFYDIKDDINFRSLINVILSKKINYESYSRAGRELRELYPEYKRSTLVEQQCRKKEEMYKENYGG